MSRDDLDLEKLFNDMEKSDNEGQLKFEQNYVKKLVRAYRLHKEHEIENYTFEELNKLLPTNAPCYGLCYQSRTLHPYHVFKRPTSGGLWDTAKELEKIYSMRAPAVVWNSRSEGVWVIKFHFSNVINRELSSDKLLVGDIVGRCFVIQRFGEYLKSLKQ